MFQKRAGMLQMLLTYMFGMGVLSFLRFSVYLFITFWTGSLRAYRRLVYWIFHLQVLITWTLHICESGLFIVILFTSKLFENILASTFNSSRDAPVMQHLNQINPPPPLWSLDNSNLKVMWQTLQFKASNRRRKPYAAEMLHVSLPSLWYHRQTYVEPMKHLVSCRIFSIEKCAFGMY